MRRMVWIVFLLSSLAWIARAASGLTVNQARGNAITWLEKNQNADGSWGSGTTKAVLTAEALNALGRAGRGGAVAAQKAIGWLRSHELASVDGRARAVRALAAAGAATSAEADALADLAVASPGWGVAGGGGVTSYDTALAVGALHAAGVSRPDVDLAAKGAEVYARQRPDGGWSGDALPVAAGSSDLVATSEILRGVAGLGLSTNTLAALVLLSSGISPIGEGSDSLVLASRLAAYHAFGVSDVQIQTELLRDSRFVGGVWSATDPLVNAIGLLAVTTSPSLEPDPADADGDGEPNATDLFPYDAAEKLDTDRDGIGNVADADDDGDGVSDTADAFPLNPSESADFDGDGTGDSADLDDDNDGVSDLAEAVGGTNPRSADSDADGVLDATDVCPTIALSGASGRDEDGDGWCTPFDECDADPNDAEDLDGDGVCDQADFDDDGDGRSDAEELAAGTDPRNAASFFTLSAADLEKDFDADGLSNGDELAAGLSMFRADTDSDGATDSLEVSVLGYAAAADASVRPRAAIAVFSSMGQAPTADTSPAQALYETGGIAAQVTGGQATPIAISGGADAPGQGGGVVNLAGFQPQTTYGRDFDRDGLRGREESLQRTSNVRFDTDGDLFADGGGGVVAASRCPQCWNLDNDLFVDGEADFGTSATDPAQKPGKTGDVAPLGHPDGRITAGDGVVALRLAADPALLATLSGQSRAVCEQAANTDDDPAITARDALYVLRHASSGTE